MLGKSPNPLEGAVKVFKAMVGLQPSVPAVIGALVFFLFLAVVGNKLVCGWACPFGALQELVYSLRRMKRKKLPFLLPNIVRGGLFAWMLLMLFGWIGGKRAWPHRLLTSASGDRSRSRLCGRMSKRCARS